MNIKKTILPLIFAGITLFGANAYAQNKPEQTKKINNPVLVEGDQLTETSKLNFFYEQDNKGIFVRMLDKPHAKEFIGNNSYDVPCTINDVASDVFKALNRGTSVNKSWLEGTNNHVNNVELRDKVDSRIKNYLTANRQSLEAQSWNDIDKNGYSLADLIVGYNMVEGEILNNNLPQNMLKMPVGQKVYMPDEIASKLKEVGTTIVLYTGLDKEDLVAKNKEKGKFQQEYFGKTFADTSKTFGDYPSGSSSGNALFDYLGTFFSDFNKSGVSLQASYDSRNTKGFGVEVNHPSGLDLAIQYLVGSNEINKGLGTRSETIPHPFLPLTAYSGVTTTGIENWRNGFNVSAEYPVAKTNFGTFKAGLTGSFLESELMENKVFETYFSNGTDKIDYDKNVKQGEKTKKNISFYGPSVSFDLGDWSFNAKALFSDYEPLYSAGVSYKIIK
ncbi:hypothetical protein COV13_00270 [Candidatus Woesearchaeota archaeon CG10_big_fil_rev_8_21_14_0_10_32_9]|nr:MAG: hypothetical protein COV13_00270 [Candidatus Woesearchaeota archaeon CG10_big_fil_rev_8_21_14_0_10_32_9]